MTCVLRVAFVQRPIQIGDVELVRGMCSLFDHDR